MMDLHGVALLVGFGVLSAFAAAKVVLGSHLSILLVHHDPLITQPL